MAFRKSTALAKAMLDGGASGGFVPAFGAVGRLLIYTGAQPATPDAAPTGVLLGTLVLSATPFGSGSAAAAGSGNGSTVTSNAITSATAVASGTAGWFRFQKSTDLGTLNNTDIRADGAIGTDLTIDNAAIVSGGTISASSLSIIEPM